MFIVSSRVPYSGLFLRAVTVLLVSIALLTACSPASPPVPSSIPVSLAQATSVPSATVPLATPTVAITVTSTLDGLTSLPHRIQWEAKPVLPADQLLSRVEFLIDGKLAWVEKQKPYIYGGDGNYLVTSFLSPGEHSFTVHVVTLQGQAADSTIKATVSAEPAPPNGLADSSWARVVTDSDVKKATSNEPPPAGSWVLSINSVGWMVHDPKGSGILFDVGYQPGGGVELRAAIEHVPPPNNYGAFCEEPDPSIQWIYTLGDGGKSLVLRPATADPCGDRLAILEGTWTRSGN